MATAKTATKDEPVEAQVIETPGAITDIRHVVRTLGPETLQSHNIWSYEDAERHLRENYFAHGWELFQAHHLGTLKGRDQGGLRYDSVEMLYILVRRAA